MTDEAFEGLMKQSVYLDASEYVLQDFDENIKQLKQYHTLWKSLGRYIIYKSCLVG